MRRLFLAKRLRAGLPAVRAEIDRSLHHRPHDTHTLQLSAPPPAILHSSLRHLFCFTAAAHVLTDSASFYVHKYNTLLLYMSCLHLHVTPLHSSESGHNSPTFIHAVILMTSGMQLACLRSCLEIQFALSTPHFFHLRYPICCRFVPV
jgi:hypothetical protein